MNMYKCGCDGKDENEWFLAPFLIVALYLLHVTAIIIGCLIAAMVPKTGLDSFSIKKVWGINNPVYTKKRFSSEGHSLLISAPEIQWDLK